ncbi:MAG: polyprenyl synthetase family protein [Desulfofustis sp.]|nr:polyprenyl synthetase family protein [Desulfofustis sp.]MBT8345520.1 polyprenyl synthetase family protein [Desulfofustis sp.]MBT8354017.1 polyprenyl synthetase family protein [Desulfofustis sp.]NNF46920.1 polyprenyl synthetase family protein [Desulfofustis sp.]NNK55888.1 polyprenyl synthetase family protein [Desulfofustis sp.]
MEIKKYLGDRKRLVEDKLHSLMIAAHGPFSDHIEAMRYSLFVGGKRIRPILCLASAEAVTGDPVLLNEALVTGCAIECIHTYSLIHDDLPAMDDDDLRRGKPTNHKLYGEAGAILAGDGLLTFAFELLARPGASMRTTRQLEIIRLVAEASGSLGMVGGQALDIAGENTNYPFEHLKTIHRSKTGALIRCAIQAGALAGDAEDQQVDQLTRYGEAIGLAFQIVDDLLDETSTTEVLGKSAGADKARGKATYPAFFGIEETKKLAQQAVEKAKQALKGFDTQPTLLVQLADYIYDRTH